MAYDELNPTASFDPFATMKNGGMEIRAQSWIKVLIGIARYYPSLTMIAYIYSLKKTNITVGFIPFKLPQIRSPFELYRKYFGTSYKYLLEDFFGSITLPKACEMGAIGVNALEPKGFRDCLTKGAMPKYNNTNEEKKISFNTYQIWLLSMLNNEQLWEQTQQIAITLSEYSKSDIKARTKKSQEVATLLTAVNKKQFIEGLTTIVNGSQNIEGLSKIAENVSKMPADNIPYFLTLIRFQYAVKSKEQ